MPRQGRAHKQATRFDTTETRDGGLHFSLASVLLRGGGSHGDRHVDRGDRRDGVSLALLVGEEASCGGDRGQQHGHEASAQRGLLIRGLVLVHRHGFGSGFSGESLGRADSLAHLVVLGGHRLHAGGGLKGRLHVHLVGAHGGAQGHAESDASSNTNDTSSNHGLADWGLLAALLVLEAGHIENILHTELVQYKGPGRCVLPALLA